MPEEHLMQFKNLNDVKATEMLVHATAIWTAYSYLVIVFLVTL